MPSSPIPILPCLLAASAAAQAPSLPARRTRLGGRGSSRRRSRPTGRSPFGSSHRRRRGQALWRRHSRASAAATDQGGRRRLGGDARSGRSGRLPLCLQRGRRHGHRPAQSGGQRIERQCLERRRTFPAPTSWTRRTCRTARWRPSTYHSTRSAARAGCTSTRRRATRRARTSIPVFYLLHGAGDCDDSWTSVGRANFILDNLIAAGRPSR